LFRSLENSRLGVVHKIPNRKEVTWPTSLAPLVRSTATPEKDKAGTCESTATVETVLESSPDEKSSSVGAVQPAVSSVETKSSVSTDVIAATQSSPDEKSSDVGAAKPTVSSVETKSSVSTDVIAATQELGESDEDYPPMSEMYDIDEVTRLASGHSSAEKREEEQEDSEEEEGSSSDEDDEISRNNIARMNLSGKALKFAQYMLNRRSERLMIKRDPNVATETYDVVRTVSAWGMSVSWLSPKAIMYAPPFSRDPSTVTLALPLLKIPNKHDPDMPIILNPVIVAITQDAMVPESSAQ
ncbi:hypothetical protein OESDEN_12697, partial [Oesophagostomum dentatum]